MPVCVPTMPQVKSLKLRISNNHSINAAVCKNACLGKSRTPAFFSSNAFDPDLVGSGVIIFQLGWVVIQCQCHFCAIKWHSCVREIRQHVGSCMEDLPEISHLKLLDKIVLLFHLHQMQWISRRRGIFLKRSLKKAVVEIYPELFGNEKRDRAWRGHV